VTADIAVIGGGPAGLMAAEVASAGGASVTIYDAMPSLGRKFLMAGRGGLNLTHSEPLDAFLSRYGGADDLRPAIEAFPPQALRAFAAELGEETIVGSSGRVFPKSWKASPFLRAWLRRLDARGVRIALRRRWEGWEGDALVFRTPDDRFVVPAPAATILALGGASWPRLGSDGGWVPILAEAGLPVSPLRPSNVALRVTWSDMVRERFAGEPLKRIAMRIGDTARRGEAVVTREGIEGGLIYALSAPVRDALDADGEALLALDLKPDTDEAGLAAALAKPRGSQSASTFLRKAANLPPVAIALLRENSRELPGEPVALARLIKAVPIRVTGTAGLDRAISTAGGLRFAALDEHLMLRGRPGTFVAGEMLDWDAPTGGYLLQACFATGARAGRVAAQHAANGVAT
jgi:uncharacterized flavoprotein (TIGR03862 family)